MSRRVLVQVVAAIVVAVFAGGILLAGGEVQASWLRFYAVAVLAALAALFVWDHSAWHWRFFQRFKAVPRDVRGTWSGTLETFWEDPETGVRPPIKPAYLVVRQTASAVSVALLTDESRSTSTFARVSDDGTAVTLDYMYLNRPDSRFEDRSRMHHGSASFDVIGCPATRLKGRYWTSRDSKGEMVFEVRHRELSDGFVEARALFSRETKSQKEGRRIPPMADEGLQRPTSEEEG